MKRIVVLALLIALATPLAFSGGRTEAATDVTQITWQVWVTPNLTREFWDGIVTAFEARNPDIRVQIIEANPAVTPSADDFIKTRLAAGDVPDLMWNLTVPFFADAGHLWPLPVDDPDLQRIPNLMDAAYNGEVYAIPATIQPQGLIYYNKNLWARAGLTDTPNTWAEFEAACARLKAAGITPIITGGEWVAGYVFVTLTSPEIFSRNTSWYADRWDNTVRFTDPDWVEAASAFKHLVDNEYFNRGALSVGYADLEQQFLAGRAAMYPMGSWFSAAEANADKDFEVGVFYAPTKDGNAHLLQSLSYGTGGTIYAGSKNPEAAFNLLKFALLDPEFGGQFLEVDGLFSALDPPIEYPMTQLQLDIMDLVLRAETTSGLYNLKVGAMPPAGLTDVYDRVGQALLAGTVTDVTRVLQDLDSFWDQAERPR